MQANKARNKKLETIPENLHRIPCPECTATDLHAPDEQSVRCSNCERVWTLKAFYKVSQKVKR